MATSYTTHCNSRSSPIVFTSDILTTQAKPICCANCGPSTPSNPVGCFFTETDGWDQYALQLNASRKLTILLLNKFDRMLSSTLTQPVKPNAKTATPNSQSGVPFTAPRYNNPMSKGAYNVNAVSNAELAELAIKSLPPEMSHGTCTFNVSCGGPRGCGSSFQFTVSNEPRTMQMPITYCPYCGQPTLVIGSTTVASYVERSIEQWRVLADLYTSNVIEDESAEQILIRIADIRAKYNYWCSFASDFKTFAQFMANYDRIIANELNNPKTPRHTATVHPTGNLKQQPKHRKIKLVVRRNAASDVNTLPVPAHVTNPLVVEDKEIPIYGTCGICGCEQANVLLNARYVRTFAAYCEPCNSTVNEQRRLRQNAHIFVGGC